MKKGAVIAISAFVLCLAIVIVVIMSFSYVNYYQFGFYRKKSTGNVDLSQVYEAGRYVLGPDAEIKLFQRDGHQISLKDVLVFSSDKLEVKLDVNFQYFLRKEDLKLLHARFDVHYKEVMKSSAIDALKGATTTFNVRQLFQERKRLEDTLAKAVRERLGGKCCNKDCDAFQFACLADCLPADKCTEDNKGLFADVKYFQLGVVELPNDVYERFMKALTLQEQAETEILKQESQVIRKNTTAMVRLVNNEANEIRQKATAEAGRIKTISEANYTSTLEKARAQGMSLAFVTLNITEQQFKTSIDYLRTIRGLDHTHLTVDFQQRIAGNL